MVNNKDKLQAQIILNAGILIISMLGISIAEVIKILISPEGASLQSFVAGCSNADLIFAAFTAECTNVCWRFLDQDKVGFTAVYLLYVLIYTLVIGSVYIIALAFSDPVIPVIVRWVFLLVSVVYAIDTRVIYVRLKKHDRKSKARHSAGYSKP